MTNTELELIAHQITATSIPQTVVFNMLAQVRAKSYSDGHADGWKACKDHILNLLQKDLNK